MKSWRCHTGAGKLMAATGSEGPLGGADQSRQRKWGGPREGTGLAGWA